MIRIKAKNHYNFKSEFESKRDKMVDQYFGHQNDPKSRPNLDSTHIGTNTTNGTTLPSDSIPVGTKSPKPTSSALPTDLPENSDPGPPLSDLPKKSNSLNDSSSSKSKKNKRNKKGKRRKDKKDDSSDPLSSDSGSSYDSDYKRKQHKRKSDQLNYPIKLCARLTAKLLTTAYK